MKTERYSDEFVRVSKREIKDQADHLIAAVGLIEALLELYSSKGAVNMGAWRYVETIVGGSTEWILKLDEGIDQDTLPF